MSKRAIGRRQTWNPRRRWFSATSILKKCAITRSRVKRSGYSTTKPRRRFRSEARNRPKTDLEPATALVFRDQHIEEVRNYAIAGETLWILNDKAAKKIPLAQLDLAATVKMNDDRGVDFQVPR